MARAESSWRKSGLLPPIFDQGDCGCCSSSVSLKCCSAIISISNAKQDRDPSTVEFAVQEPINLVPLLYPQHCEPPDDKEDDKELGCYGIRSKVNLLYVKQHQCALEEDFPYKGKRTEDLIPMDRPRLFIDDYCTLEEHNTNPIEGENFVQLEEMGGGRIISDLIKEHPVAGKAFVDNKFVRYRSGVYRAPNAIRKKLSLHALLIIGEYRTKSGVQVYDCQNSWGEDWGDKGFCKVEKRCLLKFCYAINPRVQGIVVKVDSIK
ncbi:hypothetical protein RHGRI_020304 [Rhododendron griersonianum]|uniref:Peptidase C1A papain C-terminal domain-containing protein n=1 Tax=Rhododendron griersonianum TaxID=479676 RepID=A0AAV6JK24_9ERIC|nr:hypothetical protein RHGRI_020304 [Rhododendron griersonianum]